MPQPRRCPRPGWMGPWAAWAVPDLGAFSPAQGSHLEWDDLSGPFQPKPSYDSMIVLCDNFHPKKRTVKMARSLWEKPSIIAYRVSPGSWSNDGLWEGQLKQHQGPACQSKEPAHFSMSVFFQLWDLWQEFATVCETLWVLATLPKVEELLNWELL